MNAATPQSGSGSAPVASDDPGARRWLVLGLGLAALLAAVPVVVALMTPIVFVEHEIQKTAVYRIFFLHVPAAIAGTTTLMLGILVGSVGVLWRKSDLFSRWLVACLELGLVALTFALISGMVWANSAWGTPWNWEPRLTMVAVVWLLLVGALALRGATDEPLKRERYTAVFALLIVANAPLIKWATEWFGSTLHPERDTHRAGDGYAAVQTELLVCMITINVLFVLLAVVRTRSAKRPPSAATAAPAQGGGA